MAKNIEKYLNASSDTFSPYGNGIVYKNDDAFKAENDDICYISEYALDDLNDLLDEGKDLTDAELIEQGYAESYNSIVKQIKQSDICNINSVCDKTIHEIAEYIYNNADWAYISTYILEYEEICEY